MKSFVKHESMYLCDCGYEGLLLRQYKNNDIPECLLEVAIFSQSCKCKNWKDKLRWIWAIITEKQIWADQIMLTYKEANRLGKTLITLSKEK